MRTPLIYGAVTAVAIFFVGWSTGLGGSFVPNLIFSLLMGVLAFICMVLVLRYGKQINK